MFLSLTCTLGMKGGGCAKKSRISFFSLLMHTLFGGIFADQCCIESCPIGVEPLLSSVLMEQCYTANLQVDESIIRHAEVKMWMASDRKKEFLVLELVAMQCCWRVPRSTDPVRQNTPQA